MSPKKSGSEKNLKPKNWVNIKILYAVPILILFSFALPTLKYWSIYPTKINSDSNGSAILNNYQHPLIPHISSSAKPYLASQNYILIDSITNTTLLSSGANQRIYPASITKLATALTALNIYPLDEVITIGSTYSDGKVMELVSGENITVRSLVNALLVYSANDSAYNLASHHRDGVPGFIKEMNLIFSRYGLKNTNFVNFDGIHNSNHYSTAYDLAQLARLALKNQVISETVKLKQITVTDITGTISHTLESTNELLGVTPEIEGLKTGWTPEAGGCFVSLINLNGHLLVGVVAQSENRFADTTRLVNWAKDNISWQPYTP